MLLSTQLVLSNSKNSHPILLKLTIIEKAIAIKQITQSVKMQWKMLLMTVNPNMPKGGGVKLTPPPVVF